jgi:hypothetical protein
VSDDWRDGRWHPDYPDAECFYHGVICWRDGHEERLATEDIPYELNRLDTRVAELEAEVSWLRGVMRRIAELTGPNLAPEFPLSGDEIDEAMAEAHELAKATLTAERKLLQ